MTRQDKIAAQSVDADFAASVTEGLSASPKWLNSKWFYDALGSRIFDAITALDVYYPTRVEAQIFRSDAARLREHIAPGTALVELGSGSSIKTRLVLDAVPELETYVPIDISAEHLADAAKGLATAYPNLDIVPVAADFTADIALPAELTEKPKVLFFPGSTIGNFDSDKATEFLRRMRAIQNVEAFVIGADLAKDPETLILAYDDPPGVTAAFNRNILHRINRELGANFDLSTFRHEARWNADKSRIEMHLVTEKAQTVDLLGRSFQFEAGESIHTENSHKYSIEGFKDVAALAGWSLVETWTDPDQLFSVHVLR